MAMDILPSLPFELNDEQYLVSEEEEPLSTNMERLLNNNHRFVEDCYSYIQTTAKGHNFDVLIRMSPFSQVIYESRAKEKSRMENLQNNLKEDSTTVPSKRMDTSSRSESPAQDKRTVTFCDDYSPSKKLAQNALKVGDKSKFSRYPPETFLLTVQQHQSNIPRFGRDWDEIEKRITIIDTIRARRRGAIVSDSFDHLKTGDFPKIKKKKSPFKKRVSKVADCFFGKKEDILKDQAERDYDW